MPLMWEGVESVENGEQGGGVKCSGGFVEQVELDRGGFDFSGGDVSELILDARNMKEGGWRRTGEALAHGKAME
jgi:hypothetical protein